jgi:hypothetical protein
MILKYQNTQHIYIQHDNIQQNDTQHTVIQYNDTQNNNRNTTLRISNTWCNAVLSAVILSVVAPFYI